jgi:hypothetical protein
MYLLLAALFVWRRDEAGRIPRASQTSRAKYDCGGCTDVTPAYWLRAAEADQWERGQIDARIFDKAVIEGRALRFIYAAVPLHGNRRRVNACKQPDRHCPFTRRVSELSKYLNMVINGG